MYYIGLMSGTSMDAIDAALVEFDNKASPKLYREYPIDNALRHQVRLINEKSDLGHIADLDHKLGHLFAKAVNDLLKEANIAPEQVTAIGSHGQTILHKPNTTHKTSIQIADPNIICAETGITTVADFRRMDMAYGGQGAPLASAFHQYQFQQNGKYIVILNIGGIANITLLANDGSNVIGFDTGPGNGLLDDWIQKNKNEEYDKDSLWASSGKENNELLELLLSDEYFSLAAPKSTGREYFNLQWLQVYLSKQNSEISPEDVQATLLKLSATTICNSIKEMANEYNEVLLCGGGAYNPALMKTIQNLLPQIKVSTTTDYGLTPDCIEAVTFAWLAKQRIENKPANLPSVTGANKEVLLGGVYSTN
ncbi:MAG TPA: anhydro-N-acetylmuramic acid kinase [Thiotrichaceae bacterium]|nr:anhydro-N-acetylmuramic acid kinase [Thiotrichaceae bacterium]HIM07351.1 anhydro-N-acetylmuramic acid kinase [Gammaproteobacteria bacterium]